MRVCVGEPSAATGLRGLGIDLTHKGKGTYRLRGRPAVRLLDENRAPIPVKVVAGTEKPVRTITLAPGESASAVLIWRNTVEAVDRPAVRAPYLEVTPAPGETPVVVRPPGGVDIGTTGRVTINPWAAS